MAKPGSWLLFLLAFLAGMMVTAFLRWPPKQSSDWAAWVQAFGAIGAIGVAIYVSWTQARNDRVREQEHDHAERLRILEGPIGIMGAAFRFIEKVPTESSDEAKVEAFLNDGGWLSGFMRAQTALINIPLHTVPWWGISECVLEMLKHVDACRGAVNALNHEFAQRRITVPWGVWRKSLPTLEACVREAQATMHKASLEAERIRRTQ